MPIPTRCARAAAGGPLKGRICVPGDKSISHRSLMLSAPVVVKSRITGLLEGEDALHRRRDVRNGRGYRTHSGKRRCRPRMARPRRRRRRAAATGAGARHRQQRHVHAAADGPVASHPITACFIGDASLSKRPMGRVIDPPSPMKRRVHVSPGGTLPLMMRGAAPAVPITYRLPVASAQVKSAVLLAGLNTPGTTTVIEPIRRATIPSA